MSERLTFVQGVQYYVTSNTIFKAMTKDMISYTDWPETEVKGESFLQRPAGCYPFAAVALNPPCC